jgi:spermidine synthase
MVRFAKWHPLVQFCFLLCVLLLTCLSRHPVPVALSLLGAAVYLLLTDGRRSLRSLLCVPVLVALVGGLLPAVLFLANVYLAGAFRPLLYGMVWLVGAMVGLEIPLVMRLLKRNVALKDLVSQVLTFDYLGALAVSLAFPLVLVPQLGLVRTGLVFGLLNLMPILVDVFI